MKGLFHHIIFPVVIYMAVPGLKPATLTAQPTDRTSYHFVWQNQEGTGSSWDLGKGEKSLDRSFELTSESGDKLPVKIQLDNKKGKSIDQVNCGSYEHMYTATCDASFEESACGPYHFNFGCDYLTFGITSKISGDGASLEYTFEQPVQITDFSVSDIDFNAVGDNDATWNDVVILEASLNGNPVPLEAVFEGEQILVSGSNTYKLEASARYRPDVRSTVRPDDDAGLLIVNSVGKINSIRLTFINGGSDDGISNSSAVAVGGFTASTGKVIEFPTAIRDSFTVHQDSSLTGQCLQDNGWGSDYTGDKPGLKVGQVTSPFHGTLELERDGSFTYVPAAGFTGLDEFAYYIEDAWGNRDVTTVELYVTGQQELLNNEVLTASNDEEIVTFKKSGTQDEKIVVFVQTDAYPTEMSWTLYGPGGKLESVGGYEKPNQTYTHEIPVREKGTYFLVCGDSYGDGWNTEGKGSIRILYDREELISVDEKFYFEKKVMFDIEDQYFYYMPGDPRASMEDVDAPGQKIDASGLAAAERRAGISGGLSK